MSRTATETAGQTRRQFTAAGTLRGILEHAVMETLPPIAWTVQADGAALMGQCYATTPAGRRQEFTAWRDALTRWARGGADVSREHASAHTGMVRLTEHWEDYGGVSVTLVAEIYAEDEPS